MECPECKAVMDLRLAETFNAHWECPFDQQVVWVEEWTDEPVSETAGKTCAACGYGGELQPLQIWRDADREGWWIHPLCAETRCQCQDPEASRIIGKHIPECPLHVV